MADLDNHVPRWLAIALLLMGILLIVLSWTPVGRLATEAVWDRDDSAAYSRLVIENHQLGYHESQSPGLSGEQLAARQKDLDEKLDAMTEKLEYAKSRPAAWSRALFWSGAALATLGILTHFHRRQEAPSDSMLSTSLSRSHQTYRSRDN